MIKVLYIKYEQNMEMNTQQKDGHTQSQMAVRIYCGVINIVSTPNMQTNVL